MDGYADVRFTGSYRSQWGVLDNSFITTSLAFDMPYEDKFGFGVYVLHTDATNVFSSFNTVLSAAYDITSRQSRKYKLTAGLQLGFIYKRTNDNRLIFDNQYQFDAGTFDGDLPSGESFEKYSIFMPEVNLGVFYRNTYRGSDFNPYGGASLLHATMPKESFMGTDDSRLPMRAIFMGGSIITVSKYLKLDPSLLVMFQGKAREIHISVLADYQLKKTIYNIVGGFAYRHKDAVPIHLGLRHGDNTYRLSYDINISTLSQYTNGMGALELTMTYNGLNYRRRKNVAPKF